MEQYSELTDRGQSSQGALASCRSIDRQAHLVAGIILAAALTLYSTVAPQWIYLALLPTFGLTLDALTGICPMTTLLKKAPWNAQRCAD